ncbi:MAG: family 43 glycosylhydrolase [Clostridia bacterium]|nr:family 43 glycosylhydrolase [Clostridia bacterium]
MKKILTFLALFLTFLFLCPAAAFAAEKKENVIFLSDGGGDALDGSAPGRAMKSFKDAVRRLYSGGTLVICGPVSVAESISLPENVGWITVTSVYDGVDYREKEGAALILSKNLQLEGPTVFRDLEIRTKEKNLVLVCNGSRAVFDTGITCKAVGANATLPSITGSGCTNYAFGGAALTVNSGSWLRLRGGNRSTGEVHGDTYIEINGGTFSSLVEGGGETAQTGSIYMLITGGTFSGAVYGAAGKAVSGNVTIAVTGGTFKSITVSSGGQIGGSASLSVFSPVSAAFKGTQNLAAGGSVATFSEKPKSGVSGFTDVKTYASAEEAAAELETVRGLFDARFSEWDAAERALHASVEERLSLKKTAALSLERTGTAGDPPVDGSAPVYAVWVLPLFAIAGILAALALFLFLKKVPVPGAVAAALALAALAIALVFNAKTGGGDGKNRAQLTEKSGEETAAAEQQEQGQGGVLWALYGAAEADPQRGILSASSPAAVFLDENEAENVRAESVLTLSEGAKAGLYFNAALKSGENAFTLDGYYLEIDGGADRVTLYAQKGTALAPVGTRYCRLEAGAAIPVILEVYNRYLTVYVNENPLDTDPYPKFELNAGEFKKGTFGYSFSEGATFTYPVLSAFDGARYQGETYKNPVVTDLNDPDVFYWEGTYYLYGGGSKYVRCYTSTDAKTWTEADAIMDPKDVWGESGFNAPNILYRDGYFYLFYMAYDSSIGGSVTSYASAKSPLGPFTSQKKQPLCPEVSTIGGQPFVDDDGRIWLTVVRFGPGNVLYLVEIECKDGKVTVKEGSLTKLIQPDERWENLIAPVTECGYIYKHGGYYYLIYAGGNYNSAYGTGYAVAEKVTGPYVRYEGNPVLYSTAQAYGNGAVSIFPSPDGSELFSTYLRHSAVTSVRPLNTCIDRIKFVPNPAGGADLLCVYGPTVTPQPLPSAAGTGTPSETQRFFD